jgi:hypothetical protein
MTIFNDVWAALVEEPMSQLYECPTRLWKLLGAESHPGTGEPGVARAKWRLKETWINRGERLRRLDRSALADGISSEESVDRRGYEITWHEVIPGYRHTSGEREGCLL